MNRFIACVPARRRRGGLMAGLLVFFAVAGVAGWLGYEYFLSGDSGVSAKDLITQRVERGPFDHIVLEQGEIESSSNTEIVCQVESRGTTGTPILWVIDEGARVKEGDKLVELDSSQLEVQLKEDTIEVLTAKSNLTAAEATLEQAKISKEEYIEGVYKTEQKAILSEMAIANQELTKAKLALQSTERLVGKGLMKSLQVDADRFAVENANNKLESAKQQLKVLENLTLKKMLVQYDSDIESAAALKSAMESELVEETQELNETKQQIENCVMYAPTSGVVVHANRFSSRGGNAEFVVEAGQNVRERQVIIRLPDPTQMQVKCNINESRITLIREGMPAKIAIDALPDLDMKGYVTKVNQYAEPGSWMSSSTKEYATLVKINNPPDVIRTGMTAGVEIFVEQLADAIQVPIQALYEHGGQMFSLVQTGPKSFETRQVKIGATNDTMASIEEGLEVGEIVVLNLRDHLNLMDLPEVVEEDNSGMRQLRQDREQRAIDGADGPSSRDAESGSRSAGPGSRSAGPGSRSAGPAGDEASRASSTEEPSAADEQSQPTGTQSNSGSVDEVSVKETEVADQRSDGES